MRGNRFTGLASIVLAAVIALSLIFSMWSNPQIAPLQMNSDSGNPWIMKKGNTMIAADQGGAKNKPENTMKAYKEAVVKNNVSAIKVDVRTTKDGVVVACRPSTLNSVSDVSKKTDDRFAKVNEYTYTELSKLNFGYKFRDGSWNKPYNGLEGSIPNDLKIVRFSEFLDFIKNYPDIRIIVNFCETGKSAHVSADAVCGMLKSRNMSAQALLKANDWSMSKYIEYRYPEFARAANRMETVKLYFMCQFKRDMSSNPAEYSAVILPQRFGLVTLTTQKFVNYAHQNRIAVQYDSVNKQSKVDYLKSIGADAVITEDISLAN